MLSLFTSLKVVGYYSVPTRLFGTLLFIPTIATRALLPALSKVGAETPEQMPVYARKFISFLFWISLPMAVGNALIAEQVVLTLYKQEFVPSIWVLIILGFTTVPTYVGIAMYRYW